LAQLSLVLNHIPFVLVQRQLNLTTAALAHDYDILSEPLVLAGVSWYGYSKGGGTGEPASQIAAVAVAPGASFRALESCE
jgi:hypothetical protein